MVQNHINTFQHTTNLQHTNFKFIQARKCKISLNESRINRVENIVGGKREVISPVAIFTKAADESKYVCRWEERVKRQIVKYYRGSSNFLTINPFHIQTLSDASAAEDALFKNALTKEEITQNEQFLLLPQSFQLFSACTPLFFEIFHTSVYIFTKLFAADLFYVGKV